jgi:TolB protein
MSYEDTKNMLKNMLKNIMLLFISFMLLAQTAFAYLQMELTRGISGAVPIAIVPFAVSGQPPEVNAASVITNDLQNSGRFKVVGTGKLDVLPSDLHEVQFSDFKTLGADNIVIGKIQNIGLDRYRVSFQLLDVFKGKDAPEQSVLLNHQFVVNGAELRPLAHHISDLIYEQITGIRGIFSTRLAYIVVQRPAGAPTRYILEVADQDGYDPKPLLNSLDPIMSPSWSKDGRHIAYVSFENHHAAIYIHDVATGARHLISAYPGINGAPAWSPDGRKLALVLSKSGAPNIYIMDIASHQLTQLTHDFYINTEPSFSPDGRSILFTSNRSGSRPQIYQMDLASRAITRLTYDGQYNARASYTSDGSHIVVLNQESGLYNIGILDLNSGIFKVLTHSGSDSESPSIAPNGSMVLYGTLSAGRNVLGMIATDGSVQLILPARNGEVQDPAWSPFL